VLDGRVALVTGANHGIGAATAAALTSLGARVAVTYLRLPEEEGAEGRPPAYARQRRRGAEDVDAAFAVEADLTDPSAPAAVFDAAEAALGPVSMLVHNASGWRKDTFALDGAMTAATIDAQLLVDARAGALLIAELGARHRARGAGWGRIVTLTSGGPAGFPGEVSYGAAKAALENYTMSASIELAPLGITANVVYPPVTDTGWVTDDVRAFVERSADHWHVAAPEDVAEVIAWLCTDGARLVTGNVVRLR
jgi:3-oxoacyl-[acyl-carrier protein] reductase